MATVAQSISQAIHSAVPSQLVSSSFYSPRLDGVCAMAVLGILMKIAGHKIRRIVRASSCCLSWLVLLLALDIMNECGLGRLLRS